MRSFAWLIVLLSVPLLASCGDVKPGAAEAEESITVFASASLAPAIEALAAAFEQNHAVRVAVHSPGTPRLLLQLREGASADVLAAADRESAEALNLPHAASPPVVHPLAGNRLAIAFAAGNPHGIESLADLDNPSLRVALAGPEVPAGRYARRALAKAGVELRSRSDEASVQALLTKLAFGELDAALVYTTDLQRPQARIEGRELPAGLQPEIELTISALPRAQAAPRPQAEAFVRFALAAEGQQILRDHGFGAAR